MPRHRSPPAAPADGPTGRRWLVAACLASALFIAWLVWGRGPDFVAEAKGLQRQVIELYATAMEKRARERGIDFSPLRRRLLRG